MKTGALWYYVSETKFLQRFPNSFTADDGKWNHTKPVTDENWTIVTDLKPGQHYEFRIVAINGQNDNEQESRSDTFKVYVPREGKKKPDNFMKYKTFIIILMLHCKSIQWPKHDDSILKCSVFRGEGYSWNSKFSTPLLSTGLNTDGRSSPPVNRTLRYCRVVS